MASLAVACRKFIRKRVHRSRMSECYSVCFAQQSSTGIRGCSEQFLEGFAFYFSGHREEAKNPTATVVHNDNSYRRLARTLAQEK